MNFSELIFLKLDSSENVLNYFCKNLRIIPESPRWLLAKGKSTEADIALEKMVKYNGCCTRSKTIKEPDILVSENQTPVNMKPDRKSRNLSLDLKSKKVEEILPETENLLPKETHPEIQSNDYYIH